MFSLHPHRSVWQLSALVIVLLLCSSGLHPAFAQDFETKIGESRPDRAPNPRTNLVPGKRTGNRSRQTSSSPTQPSTDASPDYNQQALEEAIQQGNTARDANDYEQALAHYQKAQTLDPKEARAFYGMGNLYADLSCQDSAIEAYLKALKLKKDFLEALLALGYTYAGKERNDEAASQFQAILKIAPGNAEANIGLGLVYMKKAKYQEALTQINQVLNAQAVEVKDRAAAHMALGWLYWGQEKHQEAIAQYQKAIALKPDLARAYLILGIAQISLAFNKFMTSGHNSMHEASPQRLEALRASAKQATDNMESAREHGYNHPHLYILMANALLYQFRYQDARNKTNEYFAKVKELERNLPTVATKCVSGFDRLNADGYWHSGHLYKIESDFEADDQRKNELLDKAVEQFKQVIKLKQDYTNAYWSLAIIYDKQRKNEEAISQYQNAIRYGLPEEYKAAVYEAIGLAHSRLGRYDKAIESVQEAIKLNPNTPSFYESLASIYISQGNLEQTFNALKKATELRTTPSTNAGPYYFLGTAYVVRFLRQKKEEDFNEAVKWLKKAIEIRPDHAYTYIALGIAYKAHSNADEALANFSKAIEYDPKYPDTYVQMARVYSDLKHNDDAAIERFKKAIEVKPDNAEAYWRLGLVYQHKKDDAQAIKQMLKAVEFDPKHLQAHLDLASIYRVQKNYPEAIQHVNRAIEIAPTDFLPYKELAKVYEDQGKNEDAVRYYEEAINRLGADDSMIKTLYQGRVARLRGQYAEAISHFQKLNFPEDAGWVSYEIGLTHVANKNRSAALVQHQQLVQMKSPLAEELQKKIKEMK
jgi:tetratricopeptide (TPR) repeat protein